MSFPVLSVSDSFLSLLICCSARETNTLPSLIFRSLALDSLCALLCYLPILCEEMSDLRREEAIAVESTTHASLLRDSEINRGEERRAAKDKCEERKRPSHAGIFSFSLFLRFSLFLPPLLLFLILLLSCLLHDIKSEFEEGGWFVVGEGDGRGMELLGLIDNLNRRVRATMTLKTQTKKQEQEENKSHSKQER